MSTEKEFIHFTFSYDDKKSVLNEYENANSYNLSSLTLPSNDEQTNIEYDLGSVKHGSVKHCTDNKNAKIDFIWENISDKWQDKLLSSNFFIKNCLADGNCQFRSIETALNNSGYKTNHKKLRNLIIKYINNLDNKLFFNIIQNYRLEKDHGEFIGNWDPYSIKNKSNFIKEIKKTGFHFQGDHITLDLISNALNIQFVILTSDYNIINLSNKQNLYNDTNSKLIILYYNKPNNNNDHGHYQSIGFKYKRKIESIFKTPFPKEIENLLDKNNLLASHLNHILNNTNKDKKLQLNNIFMSIQKKLHKNISLEDKHTIMLFLTFWLKDNQYFEKEFSKKEKNSIKKNSIKRRSLKKNSPKKNSLKKNSPKRRSPKRRSPKKNSLKKNSPKKNSLKKNSPKKNSLKKNSPKKNSLKKNSIKRRSPKKNSPKKNSLKKNSPKKNSLKKNSIKRRSPKKNSLKKN